MKEGIGDDQRKVEEDVSQDKIKGLSVKQSLG